MMQPVQIFGWIILVVLPLIFFTAVKPEKTANLKDAKRIACFVLMGIFALGVVASLLAFLSILLRGLTIPAPVWRFLTLGNFRPAPTAILIPLFSGASGFWDFWMGAGRVIFQLLNLLFSAGMIFFYATKAKQLNEGVAAVTGSGDQLLFNSGSSGSFDTSSSIASKFSGGVLSVFLFWIGAPILSAITLFLAVPFVCCTAIRWVCNNSTIGGKRYRFTGTAVGLFGRYIIWYLLTVITIGIYSFWAIRNLIRWVIENIEMVD